MSIRHSALFEVDPNKFGADNIADAARVLRLCAKGARLEAAGRSTRAVERQLDRIREDSLTRAAEREADRQTKRDAKRRR